MSRGPSSIKIITLNVAKNFLYLDVLLENLKDSCDVLFVQEPLWKIIRMAPSMSSPEAMKLSVHQSILVG